MSNPQFKEGNLETFNERQQPLYMLRRASLRSIVGLYFSQIMLYLGFTLIFLNNMNIIAPGNYFGVYSWVTVAVFSIGLIINFISIPYLYFSSFVNFRNDNDYWDKETFWILPLFFFGTFFLYCSQISTAVLLLVVSVITISIIHLKFIWSSWKLMQRNIEHKNYSAHHQYYMTLKYLTVYYLLLLILLVLYNPLERIFVWIRHNI